MEEARTSNLRTFFVYVDWTMEDAPRPFYVGKGTLTRVNLKTRNKHHCHISTKYGYRREVIVETVDEAHALQEEVRLIAFYHTFVDDPAYNGIGCNYTIGGDGTSGHRNTPDQIEKWRLSNVGCKRTPEQCANISAGLKGKRWTPGRRHGAARIVAKCDENGVILETYASIAEAARAVDGYSSSIVYVAQGRLKQHRGFRWQYVVDNHPS